MDFKEKDNLFILMNDAQILLILIGVAILEIVLLKAFFSKNENFQKMLLGACVHLLILLCELFCIMFY